MSASHIGKTTDSRLVWVSPKDMKVEIITKTQDYITDLGLIESTTCLLEPGVVLVVVRSGILKHSIPVAINNVPVSINQDMKGMIPDSNIILSKFLLYWIYGLQKSLLPVWSKSGCTVESIEMEYMFNSSILLPLVNEQHDIIKFIEAEKEKIDKMVSITRKTIKRLTEYRTALITAAVTGKVDVRNVNFPNQEPT